MEYSTRTGKIATRGILQSGSPTVEPQIIGNASKKVFPKEEQLTMKQNLFQTKKLSKQNAYTFRDKLAVVLESFSPN